MKCSHDAVAGDRNLRGVHRGGARLDVLAVAERTMKKKAQTPTRWAVVRKDGIWVAVESYLGKHEWLGHAQSEADTWNRIEGAVGGKGLPS